MIRTSLVIVVAAAALLFGQLGCGGDAVQVSDRIVASEVELRLELVADGFAAPLWGEAAPGVDDVLFVADQLGTITGLPLDGSDPFTMLDVGPAGADLLVPLPFNDGFDERGLLGFAFHPDYADNGLLYTYTSEPLFGGVDDPSQSIIREWQVGDPSDARPSVGEESRVLLRVDQPQANHNGGALVFDDDGYLYIALGDGGARDDEGDGHAPGGNGQDLTPGNWLGKILRIDPLGTDGADGAYGIPADNPFVGGPADDEIFAYGFRNPFRISWDSRSGVLHAADVGQRDIEEIDVVVAGGNYGWPIKEGSFLFDGRGVAERGSATVDSPLEPADLIDPIAQYDHTEGVSVTGGFVYRGAALPELTGRYVFGDLTTDMEIPDGRLFHLEPGGTIVELIPDNADEARLYISGFGRDAAGELYVMGIGRSETAGMSGQVWKLVSALES